MRSIHSILLDLNETSANIEASAIISTDGLIMAAALPQGMDEDCVGALSAALHSVGSHSTRKLVGGAIDQILIKGPEGYILTTQTGKDAILTVITKTHGELDHILSQIRRSAEKIMAIM